MDAQKLACFRVDYGDGGYKAMEMTEDEIFARRSYIYSILRENPAWRLTPEQVDNVRIFKLGDTVVIEDEDYLIYAL